MSKRRSGGAEERALERIVRGAWQGLTGRSGEPLRYTLMRDTPVGLLGLAAGTEGLVRLSFTDDEDRFLARALALFPGRPILADSLDRYRRALDRYFSGRSLVFDVPWDLSILPPFEQKVLQATARIPAGHVASYAEVAARAGSPRASRAAGNALNHNPVAIVVPCHRVVRSDGSLGGYGGGRERKEWLLEHEGAIEPPLG